MSTNDLPKFLVVEKTPRVNKSYYGLLPFRGRRNALFPFPPVFFFFAVKTSMMKTTLCLNFVSALHTSDFASCYQVAYRHNSVPPMQSKGSCDNTSKYMKIMCGF